MSTTDDERVARGRESGGPGQHDEDTPKVAKTLSKGLNRLALATVILYGALVALGIGGYIYEERQERAILSQLCLRGNDTREVFRARLIFSLRDSSDFLKDNPQGAGKITREIIIRGMNRTEVHRQELANTNCEKFVANPIESVLVPVPPLPPDIVIPEK